MKVQFTKMHGAGNDYIYVNTMQYDIQNPSAVSVEWSKPHFGIGSDGLILIGKPTLPTADFSMRIFNNDGSEAMMCGNGARCVAKYLYDKHLTRRNPIRLETLSGIKVLSLSIGADDTVQSVTVDMGEPSFDNAAQCCLPPSALPKGEFEVGGFRGTFVSMGNPHFVIFTDDDVEQMPIDTYGPQLEHSTVFPQRCNIEFAQLRPDGTIRMRVWERGSGITLACGTGACATAVAAALTGRTGRQSAIQMDGGRLNIEWNEATNHVMMMGEAVIVFEGEIDL
ncbi:MAG: diaminopimelate epimerase [Bacteroidales bacterium]|nr:diaminopimelate epimerase [Bacteroidales bacterium]